MKRRDPQPGTHAGTPARASGVASPPHQPLRRPDDDVEMADALGAASLADAGAGVEDHLRDRDSKGVAGGYDDSIARDARTGRASDRSDRSDRGSRSG